MFGVIFFFFLPCLGMICFLKTPPPPDLLVRPLFYWCLVRKQKLIKPILDFKKQTFPPQASLVNPDILHNNDSLLSSNKFCLNYYCQNSFRCQFFKVLVNICNCAIDTHNLQFHLFQNVSMGNMTWTLLSIFRWTPVTKIPSNFVILMPELIALNTLFLIDFLLILINFQDLRDQLLFSISGFLMNTKKHFKNLSWN